MKHGLKPYQENYLRSFHFYEYLTKDQVTRLHHYTEKMGSRETVGNQLKKLVDEGYLTRDRPARPNGGTYPYVYWLALKGWNHLKELGQAEGRLRTDFTPTW